MFTSCGQKHKAETVVGDFIETYAKDPDAIRKRDFVRFDSTKVIGDSLVKEMQTREHELFKQPIPYPVSTSGRVLYLLRMNYVYQGDTLWQTFYLDESLENVVAFK